MSEQTKCVRKGDLGCTHDGECETPPMSEREQDPIAVEYRVHIERALVEQRNEARVEADQLREALRGFTDAVEGSPHGECFDRKSPTYLRARVVLGDTPDE
jgi:hypothetical protein